MSGIASGSGDDSLPDACSLLSESDVAGALGVGGVTLRGDAGACIYAVGGISAVQLSITSSGSAAAAATAAARGNPIEVGAGATASIEEKAAGVRAVVVAVGTTLATLAITSRDVSDDAAAVLARLVADRL